MKRLLSLSLCLLASLTLAQEIHVNDEGNLREIREVWVNDNGELRQIREGWVNDQGALRQFFVAVTVTLSGEDVFHVVPDPQNALAALRFDTDGNVYKIEGAGNETQIDTGTDWIRPVDSASSYQFRYTNLVGDALTGVSPAEDSWQAISGGDFILQMAQAVVGSRSATFDVEVRRDTGPLVASATYSLTASVEP